MILGSKNKNYFPLIFSLILLLGLFFFAKVEPAKAGWEHNIYQWLWSNNIGWFALNNVNCLNNNQCVCPPVPNCTEDNAKDYGLNIDYNKLTISGFGWSEYTGWVCFGDACKNVVDWDGNGTPGDSGDNWGFDPPGSNTEPKIELQNETDAQANDLDGNGSPDNNPNIRKVNKGWARILNLAFDGKNNHSSDEWGWVSLTWQNTGAAQHYWVQANFTAGGLEGWAWSGTVGPAEQGQGGYGWIAFKYKLEQCTISGTVTDQATSQPIAGATVFTDAPVYTTQTDNNGEYTLSVPYSDADGYIVTAAKPPPPSPGYNKSQTSSGLIDKNRCNITLDFSLKSVALPAKEIKGVVFRDIEGGIPDQYDPGENITKAIGDPIVITAQNTTYYAFSYDGSYTLSVPAGTYNVCAYATGFNSNCINNISSGSTNANIPLEVYQPGAKAAPSWVQTWWSDIHSNAIIKAVTPPPSGPGRANYGNASFLITAANEITNWKSYKEFEVPKGQEPKWELKEYEDLGYTGEEGGVFNPIDINRLKEQAKQKVAAKDNVISGDTVSASDFATTTGLPDNNGSHIWYRSGDLNVTSGTFNEGAKTIIVDGNLTISGNIGYKSGTFSKSDLPSVGFIVRGNVIIRSNVKNIVGAFYVDKNEAGQGGVFTVRSNDSDATPPPDLTETPITANNDKHFICEGLIVAREFNFQRSTSGAVWIAKFDNSGWSWPYAEYEAPAEVIYYDGRIAVNTPQGFTNFAQALPKWEER